MRIEQGYGIRYSEEAFSEEPKKKYFFACEGKDTEYQYLKGIESIKVALDLDPLIEIIPIKHDEKTPSNPLRLKDEAEKFLKKECTFSSGLDKFILVVDRDKKSFIEDQYDEVLNSMDGNNDYTLVVSNPCFELWLFLHHDDLSNLDLTFVAENPKVDVDKTTKTSHRTYMENCLKEKRGGSYNKTRLLFNRFYKDKVDVAIKNSKKYSVDVNELKNKVGTNFGILLESMKK